MKTTKKQLAGMCSLCEYEVVEPVDGKVVVEVPFKKYKKVILVNRTNKTFTEARVAKKCAHPGCKCKECYFTFSVNE